MEAATELERFKTDIDLVQYAYGFGYSKDLSESGKTLTMLRHRNGDKIAVSLNHYYIYVNNHNAKDSGTIVDFHLARTNDTFPAMRDALRAYLPSRNTPSTSETLKEKPPTDIPAVQARLAGFHQGGVNQFLVDRAISPSVQRSLRFANTYKTDDRGNVIFPHQDHDGLVGYEVRNHNYHSFAKQGVKTVWLSNCFKSDRRLVIGETAIDLISYSILFPSNFDRFLSTGGNWGEPTTRLLLECVKRFEGLEVVFAHDHDADGLKYVETCKQILTHVDVKKTTHQPPKFGYDWNRVLTESIDNCG